MSEHDAQKLAARYMTHDLNPNVDGWRERLAIEIFELESAAYRRGRDDVNRDRDRLRTDCTTFAARVLTLEEALRDLLGDLQHSSVIRIRPAVARARIALAASPSKEAAP